MKERLKALHRQLVKNNRFETARLLLKLMRTGSVFISDGADEAYESGAANFLMEHLSYSNQNYGLTVYFKKQGESNV